MTFIRSPNWQALGVLAMAALATAAVSLTTLNGIKDYAVTASLAGQPIRLGGALATIGVMDVLTMLLAGLASLAVLLLELRQRSYTRLLTSLSGGEAVVFLTILVAWFGHSYWGGGVPLGGDTATHVSRFLEVSRGLQAGTLARWTNYQYAGAPLLWFTGPLTYVVGGVLAFLMGDAVAATKLFLFACHMLGGWLYYAFLRRLGVRRLAAVVVAAAFAGSFAHLHLFLFRGVVPQALTIVFLIMLFDGADILLRGPGRRWTGALAFALATAGLIVNHQPHALFAAAYLALFGVVALALGHWQWWRVPVLVGFGVLGAIAAVVAVLPVVVEADWVMIEPEGALFGLHLPTAGRVLNLVLWRDTRTTWGIDYWAYLGLGLLVFAAAGLVGLVRGQLPAGGRQVVLPACVCLVLCLFMYSPVVRDVIFILFFLSIVAAFGLDWLQDRKILTGRILLGAVLLAMLDLASTSIQPVMRNDKQFMVDAGQYLEQTDPQQRIVQLTIGQGNAVEADLGPDAGPISYRSTVQRIAGNHNMAATRLHNYLLTTAAQVETDLRQTGRLQANTRSLLAMFNVGRVICNTSFANGCPASFQDTEDDAVLGRDLRTIGQPAIFSQHLVRILPGPRVEKPMLWPDSFAQETAAPDLAAIRTTLREVVSAEGPVMGAVAPALAVQAMPPESTPQPVTADWHAKVVDYQVTLTEVRIWVETSIPAWAQLAHPWFPSTTVTVNGRAVQPLRGTLDLMVVPLPAGTSSIELHDGTTRVRTLSELISLFGLLAIGIATVLLARHDRRSRQAAPAQIPSSAR